MRIIESIKNILTEQINNYRVLLELLQRERECLINLDVDEVENLSKEKDTIVLKLRLLEEERIRLIKKYSADNAMKETVSLLDLFRLTADKDFQLIRSQLISLLQGIRELNEFNMVLIERSLSVVRHSVGFLESFGLQINQINTGLMFSKEI
jgi:flagellar biosynthesis/type III secretory pathway chaperone